MEIKAAVSWLKSRLNPPLVLEMELFCIFAQGIWKDKLRYGVVQKRTSFSKETDGFELLSI